MQTKSKRACVSAAIVGVFTAALAGAALAQAADPPIGSWKLNLATSRFSPGPAPKSGTTQIEAAGAAAKVTRVREARDPAQAATLWSFRDGHRPQDL